MEEQTNNYKMKYLLALMLCLGFLTKSQASKYSFAYTEAKYETLNNSFHIKLDKSFNNGFLLSSSFKLLGSEVLEIKRISNNGEVFFKTEEGEHIFISTLNNEQIETNLENGVFMKPIVSYEYNYEQDKRILKMQWNWNKFDGEKDIDLSYQLWLYEDGNFEIHFNKNYTNDLLEVHSMMGVGYTDENLDGRRYAFGTNPMMNGINKQNLLADNGVLFSFQQNDFIEAITSINYQMDNATNIDLFIELKRYNKVKISIDDKNGNELYSESLEQEQLIERNIDLENMDDVYYINIETPEKIYVKQVALK